MNRCPQRTIQSRRKLLAWSCVRALSGTQLCRILCNPWTVAQQAPLSIDFSRQEYWSGLPCPPPGDLPDSGIKPAKHKRQPEFPVVTRESRRNSRKTTWLPRHRKMKPFPATAPPEKSHVRNWRSKGHLAPLMRPTKFPEIPVSLERNTEVFRHPLL